MFVVRQLVCIVCLAAGVFAGTAASPNIILITLDTVRADRMGFLGSKRGLTPNLDALARQSVVFTHAYSQVPLTTASHATILTGTYPQFHQVNDFQVPLGKDLPYAPDILRTAGYGTAAFVGSMVLDPKQRFAHGFERGFNTYDAGFQDWHPGLDRYHTKERRGDEVVRRALAWLNGEMLLKKNPTRPFFLWVHLYDAHYPYDPPLRYKRKYAAAPYDGEIAYMDSAVGTFLNSLRARGLYDGAVIAVMADHGEGLGDDGRGQGEDHGEDHGEDTHGIFLYDETIRVPLLIKLPGEVSAGKQVDTRVGLVDVLPTILQVVGVPEPTELQGESLLGMMTEAPSADAGSSLPPEATQDRPAYSETDYPRLAFGWSSLRALRAGKYLYIDAPRPELYDLSADPKAEHNLSATAAAVTGTLAAQLAALREKTSTAREAPTLAADPLAQQQLAALGYIASGSNDTKADARNDDHRNDDRRNDGLRSDGLRNDAHRTNEQGADPKDKIAIANELHQTNFLMEDYRFKEAVPRLQRLIAKEPGMPLAYVQLASCFMSLQEFVQALPVLRKLVELNPAPSAPHFQLALALLALGKIEAAVPELETVVDKIPRWDQAHLMLATAYFQIDRPREAVTECEKVLEIAPKSYAALLLEGRMLVLSKQPEAALPKLKAAAALNPEIAEPHTWLAKAYDELRQKTEAARERAQAGRMTAR